MKLTEKGGVKTSEQIEIAFDVPNNNSYNE